MAGFFKALELQGFKSFPDRLRIDFHPGVTAIVGPNGSGKSNIADAIRWVLGEQSSRSLRGSRMEDVIFAGTQSRRQTGYAEVALHLDNTGGLLKTEYAEVIVARRYYRSGESEYSINRQAVRLRDVHELFMDTGLGRDGYSIIGQGRIDEVLAMRPEDRRELFDEAAGIAKCRSRRDEARRRLEAAEVNLARAQDILSELDRRLEPLFKQAQKERAYNALRDELKRLELALWLREMDEAAGQYGKAQGDLEAVKAGLEDSRRAADFLYAQAEAAMEALRALEQTQDSARAEFAQGQAERTAAESAAALHRANLTRNNEELERLRTESEDYQGRGAQLIQALAEKEQEAQAIAARVQEFAEQITELQAREAAQRASLTRIAGEEEALRAGENALREEENRAQVALSVAEASLVELENQREALDAQAADRQAALEAAEKSLAALRREAQEGAAALSSLANVVTGYERRRELSARREEEARDAHTQARIRLGDLQNRIRLLRELEREYEGYSKAVKAVMQRRRELAGIRGPVSSLMRAKKEHVLAVETALGGASGHIVVDDEEAARAAIEMLKRRDEGRATFLPLTVLRGEEIGQREFAHDAGFIGIASQLVEYEAEYAPVVRNLLGRCVVIDNMDNAIAAARRSRHRYKIVTLDGQQISPGGAMTGGSPLRSTGAMSRAAELSELNAQEKSCGEAETAAAQKYAEAQRVSVAGEYSLRAAREELAQGQKAQTERESDSRRQEQLVETLREAAQNRDAVARALEKRRGEQTAAAEAHGERRAALRREQAALAEQLAAAAQAQNEARDALSQTGQALTLRREALGEAQGEAKACASATAQLQAHLDSVGADRARREERALTYQTQNQTLEADIAAAIREQQAMEQKCTEIQARLDRNQAKKLENEAGRVRTDRMIQEKTQEQLSLEREALRLENQMEALRQRRDNLTARLWDEYGLTRAAARAELAAAQASRSGTPEDAPEAPESAAGTQKRADELRRQIRALGSVNTGAIEEYQREQERRDFLETQRNDAEASRQGLLTVIAGLQKEMRSQFAQEFTRIGEAFHEIFAELFGGGEARLSLQDPSDVLESGVEISVRLPGKTLKVLSLLSGGERAFVAIALYFAFLRVRPAPFCILDEIDAALDEVNTARFARFLRQYTEGSQVIVITHRRNTIEMADMLYGVAMPTQGVSRLLPFDLRQAEEHLKMKDVGS